jgi:hypothetical protein
MRKLLVALAFGAASIVAPLIPSAPPASAALPPNQCIANGGNYYTCLYRWLACGPYRYNRYTGYSCDACGWCIA